MSTPIEAESMSLTRCTNPRCNGIHFNLWDENEKLIAYAVLQPCDAVQVAKALQDVVYVIATENPT